jgi:hypothetical protein
MRYETYLREERTRDCAFALIETTTRGMNYRNMKLVAVVVVVVVVPIVHRLCVRRCCTLGESVVLGTKGANARSVPREI